MQKFLVLVGLALVSIAQSTAAEPTAKFAWPHEQSDIHPDARVTWGRLDNGLRYAVLPTKSQPGRGSLRMLVLAGSAMEDDDQQGAAHFLEHMAFNGTKNFPPGEAFAYFQRLGMEFGAHTNAQTSIDHTVYQLELPRTEESLTRDGFKLFRDFFDGMLLDEREVEKERGVVLSEQTARNTAAYRATVAAHRASLAGTKPADRLPLGKQEVIRKISRQRLADFYAKWYTPGRTILIAAGDFDAAKIESEIRKHFADAGAGRTETPDPDLGRPTAGRGLVTRCTPVADASAVTVTLARIEPAAQKIDNMADERQKLVELLVQRLLNERLEKLTDVRDAVIDGTGVGEERLYNVVQRNYLSIRCRPERWHAAVTLVEQELRRAIEHGFTAGEVTTVKGQLTAAFASLLAREETDKPSELADEIVKSLTERNVFAPFKEFAAMVQEVVPAITNTDCNASLRRTWDAKDLELAVSGNVNLSADDAEQIRKVYEASRRETLSAPIDAANTSFAFTDFGPAGKVVRRAEQADLGIMQAAFANGVRVNVKPTKFEKDTARVVIRFGGGLLEMPADKPGLQLFAQTAFIAGGLQGVSLNELNRQIGDKNVGLMFAVGDDAFQIGGPCLSSSLELQLQVCAAYLTAAAFASETERQFFDAMAAIDAQRTHSLEGTLRYDAAAFLRSDDARYRFPQPAELRNLKLADVKQWMAKPLAEGYLEATIVGDVDAEQVLAAVAQTLGALSQRQTEKPSFASARNLKFPTERAQEFQFESEAPRAAAVVCWQVSGYADVTASRRTVLLNQVLADRVRRKIREELGVAYTPSVDYVAGEAYPEFGFVSAEVCVDPANLAQVKPLLVQVAAELATGEISDDEFQRAVQPLLSGIDAQRQDNSYWLGAISDCQSRPAALDAIRTKRDGYTKIGKAEVSELAREYLKADRAVTVSVAPAVVSAAAN